VRKKKKVIVIVKDAEQEVVAIVANPLRIGHIIFNFLQADLLCIL
jgi:hypothetical protein